MENNAAPAEAPVQAPAPQPRNKKSLIKKIVWMLLLAAGVYVIYYVLAIYLSADHNLRQIYLVPRDAAVIIQTSDPVNDWKRLSASEPWQCLKGAPSFAEVARNVNALDSTVKANRTLLSLVGKRDMTISLHKTRPAAWDFLIVVDMQKAAKINALKDNIEQVFKMSGFRVTERRYKGVGITESYDPLSGETLYSAFIENHLLATYGGRLIEKAVDEMEHPLIGLEDAFVEVERQVAGKGLGRIYLNYAFLPQFLQIYLGQNPYVNMVCNSMDYAGLYLVSDKEKMELTGMMTLRGEPDPYVGAFIRSGSHRMQAHTIMPARTALYANLGFESTSTFVKELEKAMAASDPQGYESYKSSRRKLENYFDISLEKNFLGWMDGEFALSQSEPGLLGREPELILVVRATSIGDARKNMELIEKRITRRTPVSVKAVVYKDYQIKYIELSGFFRLFFGKLFDKFDKPYYTYVGDYVVFSNKHTSLLSFIEDYEQKNLMEGQETFRKSYSQVHDRSTAFVYADMARLYPQLRTMLSADSWSSLQANRDVLMCFPGWTFQAVAGKQLSMQVVMNYAPPVPAPETAADTLAAQADSLAVEPQTEREIMSELKRFAVENFEGNILREYYPGGELKSESEVRDGKRHGRYREFYPDGNLKVRGSYSQNKQRGVWKYYTEDQKLDHKQRF